MVGFGAADEVKITPQSPTKGTPSTPPSPWDCCDGQILCSMQHEPGLLLFPFCRSCSPRSRLRVHTRICRPRTKLGQMRPALLWCCVVVLRLRSHSARQRVLKNRPMRGSLPLTLYIRKGETGSAHLPITCRMGQRNAAKRRRGLKSGGEITSPTARQPSINLLGWRTEQGSAAYLDV